MKDCSSILYCCRFEPDGSELAAAVGNLPCMIASMLSSLPMLCDEPVVAAWRFTGDMCKEGTVAMHDQQAVEADGNLCSSACTAEDKSVTASKTADSSSCETADESISSCQRAASTIPRDARHDVLLVTSGALEIQVSRYDHQLVDSAPTQCKMKAAHWRCNLFE